MGADVAEPVAVRASRDGIETRRVEVNVVNRFIFSDALS